MTPRDLVQEVGALFSLPDVVLRLNGLIESGRATSAQLAELVELDAGLAAAVLKLANSAWYGLPSRVDTVRAAITLIGQRALRDLALAAAVVRTFRGIPGGLFDMRAFWDDSTTCGAIARQLGRSQGVREEERLFIAGLLADIGKLVFVARRPETYREVLAAVPRGDLAVAEAERRVFGFDHAVLGAELLRAWKLPEVLAFLVGSHLAPLLARAWPTEAAIIHAAAETASRVTPAIRAGRPVAGELPALAPEILDRIAATPADIAQAAAASAAEALEIMAIINPPAMAA